MTEDDEMQWCYYLPGEARGIIMEMYQYLWEWSLTHGSTVTSYARKYSFKESMREDLKVIADTCLAHC
jgi:hypothetical protein